MVRNQVVLCVESLVGEETGTECIKLETQVVLTRTGCLALDTFPWEEE